MRRRLYVQIFATVVAALLAFALLSALAFRMVAETGRTDRFGPTMAVLVELALGETAAPDLQARLERVAAASRADLTLLAADGSVLASVGRAIPRPPQDAFDPDEREAGAIGHWDDPDASGWRDRGDLWAMRLAEDRMLLARPLGLRAPRTAFGWLGLLLLLGATIALVAYPVTRRLTRRLERLQAGVEALGAGRLSTRVAVEGRDEVASLAQSFNRSAERIESLVEAHRRLLANASHELRSPLARIRMAVGTSEVGPDEAARTEIDRSVAELDALVDEILVSSRLDALPDQARVEALAPVDLAALAAEEAARLPPPVEVSGEPLLVLGDERLLRRLVRNLLENARRHGGSGPIEVSVTRAGPVATDAGQTRTRPDAAHTAKGRLDRSRSPGFRVQLSVADRGPGIPAAERERVFEPFYRLAGASERAGGVGLGLALVRQIAERHGGTATVEPRDGSRGSVFIVTLPGTSDDGSA